MSLPNLAASPSLLLQALAVLSRQHPIARKRLVGIDVNYARETLQSLARLTGGWIGWEAANVRGIADELAFVPLSTLGERIASDVEVAALVNEALDDSIAIGSVTGSFASLARSLGFRSALRDSLLDVRTGGVSPAALRAAAAGDESCGALATVLERYEGLLLLRKLADPARVLRIAFDSFDAEAPFVLDGVIALAPSLSTRGLTGDLVNCLRSRGAIVLDADSPTDIPPPDTVLASTLPRNSSAGSLLCNISGAGSDAHEAHVDDSLVQADLFVAATPSDEIREALRRAMAEGLSWDEVEIVTTDPDTYGIALDALCARLGVGCTMLKGLPLPRTRIGRALDRWFAWISDGLPADVLRQSLEAGELQPSDAAFPSSRLARELRSLSIGWGRARYDEALARLDSGYSLAGLTQYDEERETDFDSRRAHVASVHAALANLLRRLFAALPSVPERGDDRTVSSSVNELTHAALAFLELITPHGQAELLTLERVRVRLAELAEVVQPRVAFSSALAALREGLSDLRSWPTASTERKPWSSGGGMVHLTDLQHAGTSGRKRIFVVGLDADRTRGGVLQDPILSDRVRAALGGCVATSTERHDSKAWRTGAALAGLRGKVTMSYALSTALDGREAGPSPLFLQSFRRVQGDHALTFKDLRQALMPPTCAVPATAAHVVPLDARDEWLGVLASGALILDGSAQIREAFAPLAAGFSALETAALTVANRYHGLVPSAGPVLDFFSHPDREISPSALETLARCPMAWFYKHGLKVRAADDPEYDEDAWLDSLQRGSLLHGIYEAFVREFMERQDAIFDAAAVTALERIVDAALQAMREKVPPPSETVFAFEAAAIARDARLFLELERQQRLVSPAERWQNVELPFGKQYDGRGSATAGTFALANGRALRVRGRADRVDLLEDGTLRIIDYKTSRSTRYAKSDTASFDGGRQLQPALYAAAVESVAGISVSTFQYRFPTEKGNSEVVTYSAADLEGARAVVTGLLGHVARGEFISTDDANDCAYCDYGAICRTHTGRNGKTESPRAAWAAANGGELYQPMRVRRGNTATVVSAPGTAAPPVSAAPDAT